MADGITLDSMSGGSVVATDDIGGVHYQIIKLAFGALDAQTIVSSSNGLPVTLLAGAASIGILGANSGVDIGDVTINNASGGSAVNIQDGGNTITVDGTVILGAGSASIGILGANSGVDIGDVTINNASGGSAVNIQDGGNTITVDGSITVSSAPFRARTTDAINATTSSDTVMGSGNIPLAVLRQPINVNANGQILISGVTNRKIRILNGMLMVPSAVTVSLKSANNSDLTGPLPLAPTGGFPIGEAEVGNFETLTGQNLTIALSASVQVGGWLSYVLV